jgi:molecular chaperone GrpE
VSDENKNPAANNANGAPDVVERPEDLMEETVADDEVSDNEVTDISEEIDAETAQTPAQDEEVADSKDNSQLAQAHAEAAKNLEGWQRTLAEFQNYKRRVEREQQDLRQRVALETLTKTLAIIDDLERAIDNTPEDLQDNPWLDGVNMIHGKFIKLLDEYQVSVIDPVGEQFDPNTHQAISKDDSNEFDSGYVIETLQKGYISGDVLLRPALVRVAN